MFGQDVCIYEKFTTCKNKDGCSFQHPTLVCDDKRCDILMCHKRHPQICLFDTIFKACRNGESCRFKQMIQMSLIKLDIEFLKKNTMLFWRTIK